MSTICFTRSPCDHGELSREEWDEVWRGLVVPHSSMFPVVMGYLGEGPARAFDQDTKMWRHPTPTECLEYFTTFLCREYYFISYDALQRACVGANPEKQKILEWLAKFGVRQEMFVVSKFIAEFHL